MTQANNDKTMKVAAIGLGWVTQNRHLPVMERNRRTSVCGVIDRQPGRASAVAKARGYRHFTEADTLANVPWLDEVDAITIGSSPFSHHALVKEALELGKHVLTEKPFTMSRAETADLAATHKAHDRALCVVHNFQFAHSMTRLLADLDAGKLGAVKSLSAVQFGNPKRRLPTWYEDLPLGLFYDESPHLLYLLRRLAGADLALEHATIQPSTEGLVTPARIDAHYSFARGGKSCPASLSCNFEAPVSEWYVMVFGSERLGIVDVFRDIYISLPNDGRHSSKTVLRTSLAASWQHWAQHLSRGWAHLRGNLFYGNEQVFETFAAAALDGRAPDGISFDDAAEVQKMQFDIVENGIQIGGRAACL